MFKFTKLSNIAKHLSNRQTLIQIIKIKISSTFIICLKQHTAYNLSKTTHCVKSVRIRSYSCLHFPAFGMNTDQNSSEYKHFYAVILTNTLKLGQFVSRRTFTVIASLCVYAFCVVNAVVSIFTFVDILKE